MSHSDLVLVVLGCLSALFIWIDAHYISPHYSKSDTWFSFFITIIYFFAGIAVIAAICVIVSNLIG